MGKSSSVPRPDGTWSNRYSASKGIPGLRKAQAAYYGRRFGVKLDPETQICVTLGSKEGFANMAQAITAPGDVILVSELDDPSVACSALVELRLNIPIFSGFGQFGLYILTLRK